MEKDGSSQSRNHLGHLTHQLELCCGQRQGPQPAGQAKYLLSNACPCQPSEMEVQDYDAPCLQLQRKLILIKQC